jgi:hypothetical protein
VYTIFFLCPRDSRRKKMLFMCLALSVRPFEFVILFFVSFVCFLFLNNEKLVFLTFNNSSHARAFIAHTLEFEFKIELTSCTNLRSESARGAERPVLVLRGKYFNTKQRTSPTDDEVVLYKFLNHLELVIKVNAENV